MGAKEDKQTCVFRGVLAKYKAERGLTVREICRMLDISTGTWSNWQHDVGRVSIRDMRRLRVALQIPVEELKEVI